MATNFSSAFVLDRAKLTRIVTIVTDRFQRAEVVPTQDFEVHLKNGKTITLMTLDEVLALDNALKNPITAVEIKFRPGAEGEVKIYVQLVFSDSSDDNISIAVRSTDSAIAQEVAAELEEQVERTMIANWMPKLRGNDFFIYALMVTAFAGLLGSLVFFADLDPGRSAASLTRYAAEKIQPLPENPTTEAKVDYVYEFTRLQVEKVRPKSANGGFGDFLTVSNVFIALPFLLIVGCVMYMAIRCYPRTVFAWGDWEEYYARLLSRRRTLWTVVVFSLVIGVVSSLFASSIFHALKIR